MMHTPLGRTVTAIVSRVGDEDMFLKTVKEKKRLVEFSVSGRQRLCGARG